MAVRLLLLALALGACGALQVGGAAGTTTIPRAAPRSAAPATMMAPRAPWETAQIPLAVVSMNPFQNLKQMGDQRVAKVSHIVLAPGQCPLPLNEALELLEQWKQEIGDDAEKFAERAKSDSQCPTAATGGALGFFPRSRLSQQFDEVIFDPHKGNLDSINKVYGPMTSPKGLHLVYVHSCREPTSKGEALLGLPFTMGGDKE